MGLTYGTRLREPIAFPVRNVYMDKSEPLMSPATRTQKVPLGSSSLASLLSPFAGKYFCLDLGPDVVGLQAGRVIPWLRVT